MPNIMSAKKALRQSAKRHEQNQSWKKKIKAVTKNLDQLLQTNSSTVDILKKEESALQKVLDKAANKNVIHKNKADRLKARYAKRITAKTNPSQDAGAATGDKSRA
ncbi:MAG TPA: 30S ribosomal protein S20 [Candidatus Saccharimonadales bacterium]|nr:30S ribosomal protein S20 [Candidatus Saccharimonadales bacterium]